jgi:hypothetical protein
MARPRRDVHDKTMSEAPPRAPLSLRARLLAALLLILAYVAYRAPAHLAAASLLLRVAATDGAPAHVWGARVFDVDETNTEVALPDGRVSVARLYTPRGAKDAPGFVVVHGVHRLGIDEPRLVRFARAISATGVIVLTPRVDEIADYRIDPISIATIGAAASDLHHRLGGRPVGVFGMSFAGGLALLAASDPRFANDIHTVVAVGAHDDLERVARFFLTSKTTRPDGTELALKAHEYGALVLVYSNLEAFFSAEDVPIARDALRAWLWEQYDAAKARSASLSPAGKKRIEALFAGDIASVRVEIQHVLETLGPRLATVSPHQRMADLRAHVFLLHGAGDPVIPASETEWLERDVPASALDAVLVSDAIQHVELRGTPSAREEWQLVHFMALALESVR